MARPVPVLPEVGSTMVAPGRNWPDCSAASIIARPMRSLTEPPGFRLSTLATIGVRVSELNRDSRTIGVLPTASRMLSRISVGIRRCSCCFGAYGFCWRGYAARVASRSVVHTRLLEWYAAQARDLPWRRTRDPYAILVAEVMLQQTQVDRVIPKWHAWLARFPTLASLAEASRADAIRQWQGLGYNMRAVRLHDIACQVGVEYQGQLPRNVDGLLRLKGIGRYTAGAIACFAHEQPVAMVDTNVRRVLSRVFGLQPGAVEGVADDLVPAQSAYAWNQALMDLG